MTLPFDTRVSEARRQDAHAIKYAVRNNIVTPTPIVFRRKHYRAPRCLSTGPQSFVIMDDGRRLEETRGDDHND